jgi:hypothetical protein
LLPTVHGELAAHAVQAEAVARRTEPASPELQADLARRLAVAGVSSLEARLAAVASPAESRGEREREARSRSPVLRALRVWAFRRGRCALRRGRHHARRRRLGVRLDRAGDRERDRGGADPSRGPCRRVRGWASSMARCSTLATFWLT